MISLDDLPGCERIVRGVSDLCQQNPSADACLAAVAATRLRDLGLPVPDAALLPLEPELALFRSLSERATDPFYEYNALLRELDSFISALEARHRRASMTLMDGQTGV